MLDGGLQPRGAWVRTGKLRAAGLAWAQAGALRRAREGCAQQVADLIALGADEASARAFVEQDLPPPARALALAPENRMAVRVFLAVCNAWLYHPLSGRPLGLLRAEVLSTMALMGLRRKQRADAFERLRVVEMAALEGLRGV